MAMIKWFFHLICNKQINKYYIFIFMSFKEGYEIKTKKKRQKKSPFGCFFYINFKVLTIN